MKYIVIILMFGLGTLSLNAQQAKETHLISPDTHPPQSKAVYHVVKRGPSIVLGRDADDKLVSFMMMDLGEETRLKFFSSIRNAIIVYREGFSGNVSASEVPIILLDEKRPSLENLLALKSATVSDVTIIDDEKEAAALCVEAAKTGIISIRR